MCKHNRQWLPQLASFAPEFLAAKLQKENSGSTAKGAACGSYVLANRIEDSVLKDGAVVIAARKVLPGKIQQPLRFAQINHDSAMR
jgi:hypothetical protein